MGCIGWEIVGIVIGGILIYFMLFFFWFLFIVIISISLFKFSFRGVIRLLNDKLFKRLLLVLIIGLIGRIGVIGGIIGLGISFFVDRGRGGVVVSEVGGCWDVEIGFTGVGVMMISLLVVVGGVLVEFVVIIGVVVVVGGFVMIGKVVVVCGVVVVGVVVVGMIIIELDVVGVGVENVGNIIKYSFIKKIVYLKGLF